MYDWDERHVLKLFHNWFKLEDIEYEQKISRAVRASRVKAPVVGDLIQVHGRNALIYERVVGESMLKMFMHKPWNVFRYARILAQLHAQMHERVFEASIPTQRSRLQYKINGADALSVALKTTLLKALDSMPECDRVCHGDFHPDNVLISRKDATVIDWIDASRGNPLADVARTSIIALGAAEGNPTSDKFLKAFVKVFHSTYLNYYFRLHPNGMDEYLRWLPIVAGARLSENIPELEQWLVQQAEKIK